MSVVLCPKAHLERTLVHGLYPQAISSAGHTAESCWVPPDPFVAIRHLPSQSPVELRSLQTTEQLESRHSHLAKGEGWHKDEDICRGKMTAAEKKTCQESIPVGKSECIYVVKAINFMCYKNISREGVLCVFLWLCFVGVC